MTREEIIQDYKDTLEERRDIHLTAYQLDHLIDWVEVIAIQVQAPVIKKIAEDMVILLDEYSINGMLQPSIIDKTLKIFGQRPYYYNEDGE